MGSDGCQTRTRPAVDFVARRNPFSSSILARMEAEFNSSKVTCLNRLTGILKYQSFRFARHPLPGAKAGPA